MCIDVDERKSWTYLFVPQGKMRLVDKTLQEQFSTFIHTTVVYKREDKHIRHTLRPTISGLLFVQGDAQQVQSLLSDNFFGIYLAKDCSTGKVATISDSIMRPFIRMSEVAPSRVRVMPHIIEYYANGNHMIKITSGILSGFEGYCVRIARDRCLVTTMGGLTIAIGGIHKETYEPLLAASGTFALTSHAQAAADDNDTEQ